MATKKNHTARNVGLGVAAVAAAAGTYYFFGKDGSKHRKAAKVLAEKAKNDVLAAVKKLKKVNSKTYSEASAKVLARYKKFQKENPEAYAFLVKELKNHWPKIAKQLPKSK